MSFKFAVIFFILKEILFLLLSYISSCFCSLLLIIPLSYIVSYYPVILLHHSLYSLTRCLFSHHSTEATVITSSKKFLFLNVVDMSALPHLTVLTSFEALSSFGFHDNTFCFFFLLNTISMTMPFFLLLGFPFFPTSFHDGRVYPYPIQSLLFSPSTVLPHESISYSNLCMYTDPQILYISPRLGN